MPSRPKASIEPIHIDELLKGAGMRGFLSVLDPPVAAPHLQELGRGGEVAGTAPSGIEPLNRLSDRTEAWLHQLARQEQALRMITEAAFRINSGAAALQRHADLAVRRCDSARFCSQQRRKTE